MSNFSFANLLSEVLRKHFKALAGIASLDVAVLICLAWTYVVKGDICYSQWLSIFRREAYLSVVAVLLSEVILILMVYSMIKRKRIRYIA